MDVPPPQGATCHTSSGGLIDNITNEWKEDKVDPIHVATVAADAIAAPAIAAVIPVFVRD